MKVTVDKDLIEQAINTIGYYASVCGEDDQDTPAKQAQATLRATLAEPVSALESVLCDPSGKCSIKGSDADRAIVDAALSALRNEVAGCFEMALGEGLAEALAETTDERLKDLVERRLMYALYAAQKAPPPPAEPARTSQDVCTVPLLSDEKLKVEINAAMGDLFSASGNSAERVVQAIEHAIEQLARRKAGL